MKRVWTTGERFAVCNAGGAFAFVGAMQDSFPHALALSKQGYNAFALIYRPGAQAACEDLARAIQFIFVHAEELEVNTDGYSLWEGSAGARMAAWVGSYGTAALGAKDLPQPAACSPMTRPSWAGCSAMERDSHKMCTDQRIKETQRKRTKIQDIQRTPGEI